MFRERKSCETCVLYEYIFMVYIPRVAQGRRKHFHWLSPPSVWPELYSTESTSRFWRCQICTISLHTIDSLAYQAHDWLPVKKIKKSCTNYIILALRRQLASGRRQMVKWVTCLLGIYLMSCDGDFQLRPWINRNTPCIQKGNDYEETDR